MTDEQKSKPARAPVKRDPVTGTILPYESSEAERLRYAAAGAAGLYQEDLARREGVHVRTIRNRMERDPRLREAWDLGLGELREKLMGKLVKIALDDSHKAQLTAIFGMLNNRYKWNQPDADGPAQGSVKFTLEMPAPMSKALYQQWLKEQATPQDAQPEEREVQEVGDDGSA